MTRQPKCERGHFLAADGRCARCAELSGRVMSAGELDALRCAANGLTVRESAARLGTTESGARARLVRAVRALGASSQPHAVALAWRAGLLGAADIDPRAPAKAPQRPSEPRTPPLGPSGVSRPREALAAPNTPRTTKGWS